MTNNSMKSHQWRTRRLWQSGLLITVLGVLLLILLMISINESSGKAGHTQAESTPDALLAKSLAEKEEIQQRYEAAANRIQSQPPARGDRPEDLEMISDPTFQTGILEGIAGPFNSQDLSVINVWQEESSEGFLQAFAGGFTSRPEQGVVVIITTTTDRLLSTESRFPTPGQFGPVSIIEAVENQLFLEAEDGTELIFDLENREYASD
jgi:hypothetical protein